MIRRAVDWAAAEVTVGRKCTQKIMHIGIFSTQQPYVISIRYLGKSYDRIRKVLRQSSPENIAISKIYAQNHKAT